MTDKPELRRALRAARAAFVSALAPGARRALETAMAERLQPLLSGAGWVASYAASGNEIDPWAAEPLLPRLAFPRVAAPRLVFHASRFGQLAAGYAGIAEPAATAPEVIPEVVLVPLLAADRAGNRLGQGQGHYDRALAALRAQGGLTAIGLAWDVQLVDMLPADAWDARLDWLVTPTQLLHFGA